ncbi:DUF2199 domain-containing protein [Acidicapsa dinghuensis]|uniref:DUF2199 domain-containing protein n=1 Tax=Acidicapsa dinghuensis TaxID=2218256 RepID=A0ABW1EC39_9BACT|nr:DUF2199 domain-containing protein [Acidicapsa dinghuensis]
MTSWKCSTCGKIHNGVANSFAFDAPAPWEYRNSYQSSSGSWIDSDYCVIAGEHFFIRAMLEIPVVGSEEIFAFGVWSSLSRANFDRERELAHSPLRVHEPSYFGWFCNRIWQYPNTVNLKCNVHSRPPGQRSWIELEGTDHPLAIEQRNGITRERSFELSEQCLHGWVHPALGVEPA